MNRRFSGEYDSIFKQHFDMLTHALVHRFFGISPSQQKDLPMEFNKSLQRRVDWLKWVQSPDGDFILHLEIQSKNDPNMAKRMLQYWLLIKNRYQLPIKQTVFYIGQEKINIPTTIIEDHLHFEYKLVNVMDIPAQDFLQADEPAEILLAILADDQGQGPKKIAEDILHKINALSLETSMRDMYVKHLEVLSKLRKQQTLIAKIIKDMALQYELKDDIRFLQGKEEGQLEGKLEGQLQGIQLGKEAKQIEICQKMLQQGFSIPLIAQLTGLTEEQVAKLKEA